MELRLSYANPPIYDLNIHDGLTLGSENDLVSSRNKPLPEPVISQIVKLASLP